MTGQNPVFCATHLGGLRPGVLDSTQPARVLRTPRTTLTFATYDPFGFATVPPDVVIPPHTRIVIEYTPGRGARFRVVPSARLAPGVLGEGESWPRVVFLNGQTVICEREQWDIYKLDPAYDCYVPAPPGFPIVSWIGVPTQVSRPLAGPDATFVRPPANNLACEAPAHPQAQRGDPGTHYESVSASSSFTASAASVSSTGFVSSTDSASSASTIKPSSTRKFERSEHFQNLLKSSMFKSFVQSRGLRPSASTASSSSASTAPSSFTPAASPPSAPETTPSSAPTASPSSTPTASPSPTPTDSSSSTVKPTFGRPNPHLSTNPSLTSESSFGANPDALVDDFYEGSQANTAFNGIPQPMHTDETFGPVPPYGSASILVVPPSAGPAPAPFAPPPSPPLAPAAAGCPPEPFTAPSEPSARNLDGEATVDGVPQPMHIDETFVPVPPYGSASIPVVPPSAGPAPAPFAPPPSPPLAPAAAGCPPKPFTAASKRSAPAPASGPAGHSFARSTTAAGRVPKAPVHASKRTQPYARPSKSSTETSRSSTGPGKSSKRPRARARNSSPPVADPFFMSAPKAPVHASKCTQPDARPSKSSTETSRSSTGPDKSSKRPSARARNSSPPVADPFFMSAPKSHPRNVRHPDTPSLGTPDFTLPVPPPARRPGVTVDPPTPTKRPGSSKPSPFDVSDLSSDTMDTESCSSASSTKTVRPSPKAPPVNERSREDVMMEDVLPSCDRSKKRRKGDGIDEASSSSLRSPPRKRGRELSPDTLKAEADLKRAQRKRDRMRRSERHEDDQTTQSSKQFWREVFNNVRQQEATTAKQSSDDASAQPSNGQPPGSSDDGMSEARRAEIEESRRKLADLERDKPLWEEEQRKRAPAVAAEEAALRAAQEQRERAAQAAAEAERHQAAEAAAQEAELQAAEAACHAQEYKRLIAKQRSENRRAQRAKWSPWNPTRALPRYQELSKLFDGAKYSAENPVDPLMIPWPTLRSPFMLEVSDITWENVDAFFAQARKLLSTDDYKALVRTSNRRFHPDTWRKQGVFVSPDATLNAELERACNIVSQEITVIWHASRKL